MNKPRGFKCAQCGGIKVKTGRCNLCGKLPVEPGWPNEAIRMRRRDSEHAAQVAVVTWALLARAEFPELALLFAIPNGGHRNVIVAKKLKAEGVRAGVPDLMLPVARGGYHGLFIEMKAGGSEMGDGRWEMGKAKRKGVVSDAQSQFLRALAAQGFKAAVCYGSEQAENILREYLSQSCTAPIGRGGMDHE